MAFLIALIQLMLGNTEVFPAIMNSTFENAKTAFEISLGLTGVLSLWMGIMKIGERGGLVNTLARWLSPLLVKLEYSHPTLSQRIDAIEKGGSYE